RDTGGALRVGPQSPGADPGPACSGRGGSDATATDANLLLDRLPENLPGGLRLDRAAAERSLGGVDPAAVVHVVKVEILRALRVVRADGAVAERARLGQARQLRGARAVRRQVECDRARRGLNCRCDATAGIRTTAQRPSFRDWTGPYETIRRHAVHPIWLGGV